MLHILTLVWIKFIGMIKISKKIAFAILVVVTILLAVSISNINWNILNNEKDFFTIFREIRETIVFILLAIFFIIYYVKTLNKD